MLQRWDSSDITVTSKSGGKLGGVVLGIALLGTDGIYVAHNKIDGGNQDRDSISMQIGSTTSKYGIAEKNVFMGNNLSLANTKYSVYCGQYSAENVFVGNSGKNAVDYGTNNKITGLTPVSGGVGSEISEAIDNMGKHGIE